MIDDHLLCLMPPQPLIDGCVKFFLHDFTFATKMLPHSDCEFGQINDTNRTIKHDVTTKGGGGRKQAEM